MQQLHLTTRAQWRRWLTKCHDQVADGVWLVFHKKKTGKPALEYEAAVEEALCFGWIDSIIKKIDDDKYCRKFTPRNEDSQWSNANKKRVARVIKEGRMTDAGLAKVNAAKRCGRWRIDPRPTINLDIPPELAKALARNQRAKAFFDTLAPTWQKHFIGWIVTAKRPQTKERRIKESVALLAKGEKLGLK